MALRRARLMWASALALCMLLAATTVVRAVLLAFGWTHGGPAPGSPDEADARMLRLAYAALAAASAAAFAVWLRLCLGRAEQKAIWPGRHLRPGWAIAACFVPFVQLVAPYFVVRPAWRAWGPGDWRLAAWSVAWWAALAVAYTSAAYDFWLTYQHLRVADPPRPDADFVRILDVAGLALSGLAAGLLAALALGWCAWLARNDPQLA